MAFAYYHINFQNHLSEGGFVGLALLGKYVLGINPALSVLLLDIPVLIAALLLKGRKFMMNTVIATSSFSLFYALIERYSTLVIDLQGNLLIAAVLSGIVTGFATGLVLRYGGATGGDDLLTLMVSRYTGLKLGTVFILFDALVLALSLIYLPMKETLFTILAVVIAGQMITWTTSFGKGKSIATVSSTLVEARKVTSTTASAVRSVHS